mmetsp:Transcript_113376/g.331386  ORF Transcript_113376/g.331386 Transcript_113376/m.331386 type:complete len:284 (-) Transcript_113376:523-1374(-)
MLVLSDSRASNLKVCLEDVIGIPQGPPLHRHHCEDGLSAGIPERLAALPHRGEHDLGVDAEVPGREAEDVAVLRDGCEDEGLVREEMRGRMPQHRARAALAQGREQHLPVCLQLRGRVGDGRALAGHGRQNHLPVRAEAPQGHLTTSLPTRRCLAASCRARPSCPTAASTMALSARRHSAACRRAPPSWETACLTTAGSARRRLDAYCSARPCLATTARTRLLSLFMAYCSALGHRAAAARTSSASACCDAEANRSVWASSATALSMKSRRATRSAAAYCAAR